MLLANLKTAEEVLQELIQQDESDDEEQGHTLNRKLSPFTRVYQTENV